MSDLTPFLRTADSATRDQLVSLCGQAAKEIELLHLLCKMLADEDANGVAWMLSEYPHLQEIFES